jgi:phospholipid/cholesterol/gamma-HCH transport system substrate-binding protein
MAELRTESTALDQVSNNLSNLSTQLSGFVSDNRQQLRPALEKLNGVLDDRRQPQAASSEVDKRLDAFAMSLGESVSSGPFFNAYLGNLLPGQFIQPFVDAAFSDLGLDPNVLPPTALTDPQTGQPGTPALTVPYPRTGQGGVPSCRPDTCTPHPMSGRRTSSLYLSGVPLSGSRTHPDSTVAFLLRAFYRE